MGKMPEDLDMLKQKLICLEQRENKIVPKGDSFVRPSGSSLGFRIGVELLSALIVGAGLGYVLDETWESKPWMMVIFLLFGGAAGVLNVYRLSKQGDERK